MFLVNVREALGYSHEQTLNSSYALICGLMQEYAWLCSERNKLLTGEEEPEEDFEWIEMPDYKSGTIKRYRKYKNAGSKI